MKIGLDGNLEEYKSHTSIDGVIINKLGIIDDELLNTVERIITTEVLAKLYTDPGEQTFDVDHYKRIHKNLFSSIYSFAGEFRDEIIQKRVLFCMPRFINQELERVLAKAGRKIPTITDRDKLVAFIAEYYTEIDIIHPFREGNGRTIREFFRQFISYICKKNNLEDYYIDYSSMDKDEYIDAVVQAERTGIYTDLALLIDRYLMINEKNKPLGK